MTATQGKVLVPIDLSPAGDAVCRFAREVAAGFGVGLVFLHVVEGVEELRNLNLPTVHYDEVVPQLEAEARGRLESYLRHQGFDHRAEELVVTHGAAFERILQVAERVPARLIVMGTQGKRGLERAIFGSTVERVMRRARVPVVAVPVGE